MRRVRVLPGTPSWSRKKTRTPPVPSMTGLLPHACASVRVACARGLPVQDAINPPLGGERARAFGEIAHAKSAPCLGVEVEVPHAGH